MFLFRYISVWIELYPGLIFLRPYRLSRRNDVTSDQVNFRPGYRQNFFLEKKSGHQEFVWLLKQYGATVVPW